jgi:hypothetical protein
VLDDGSPIAARDRSYACVGGADADLSAHVTAVREHSLPLTPAADDTVVRLDVDRSGALLGLTDGPDGAMCAVPGFVGRAVLTVRPVRLAVDRTEPWRSCLEVDVAGTDGRPLARVGTALADLAHSMHALRTDRDLRLRAAVLATYVRSAPTVEAWTAEERTAPPRGLLSTAGSGDDADPAGVAASGIVRTVERRSVARTGRGFTVASVDCGGVVLDVCWADDAMAAPLRPGAVVQAFGRLVSIHAGPVSELPAPDGGPPGLAVLSGLLDRDPPLALRPLPGARPWSLPLPVVDLGTDVQVLAPLVSAAGATAEGVVACCVDWDLRWQLRRFPLGSSTPDRIADLPGHAEFCVAHEGGVVVLVGRELVVFDAALTVLHRATFPPDGSVAVQAGPSAVHVLVSGPVGGSAVPDEAGRRASQSGASVHRYGLHRLDLTGPSAGAWRSMDLPVSGILRLGSPGWPPPPVVGPADSAGGGIWFALPTADPAGRPTQHAVAVSADGRLSQGPVPGPPWTTSSVVHAGSQLTADDVGPSVDGLRPHGDGLPATTRWLTGDVPAVVVTDPSARRTRVLEWDPAAGSPPLRLVADQPSYAEVSRATDRATGSRWYAVSSWTEPGVLGVVDGAGPVHPVLRMRGQARLLAVAGGSAVVNSMSAEAPVLDVRTGRLVPPGQTDPGQTYYLLTTLVKVPLP